MEETELRQLALDIADGKVFGSWSLWGTQHLLQIVFMPLAFMSREDLEAMTEKKVVHLYEYLSEAGPRCINGYPIFTSFRTITEKEWEWLVPVIEKLLKHKESFLKKSAPKKQRGKKKGKKNA